MEDNIRELVPFEIIEGRIYDFGIKRINEREQTEKINKAKEEVEFDGEISHKSHMKYEINLLPGQRRSSGIKPQFRQVFYKGRIPGYCKSVACKNKDGKNSPTWSAPCGDKVLHNCIKCLGTFIINSREGAIGSEINVVFLENNEVDFVSVTSNNSMMLEFTEFGVRINNSKPVKFKYTVRNDEYVLCEILEIPQKFNIPISKGQIYKANIKGRYVCENISLGKKCFSLEKDYSPIEFTARSVPFGVPGWSEKNKQKEQIENGKIISLKYCPGCALHNFNKIHSWSNTSEREQEESWRKKYEKSTERLFEMKKKLYTKLCETEDENFKKLYMQSERQIVEVKLMKEKFKMKKK